MDITHWKAPNIRGACFDIRLWFKVWGFQHTVGCCKVAFDLQIVLDYQQNLWSGLLSKDWRLWDIPVCSHSLLSVTRLHQVWNHLENYWLLLSLMFRITKLLLPCDEHCIDSCFQYYWPLNQSAPWASTLVRSWTGGPRENIISPGESFRCSLFTVQLWYRAHISLSWPDIKQGLSLRYKTCITPGLSSTCLSQQWRQAKAQQYKLRVCVCNEVMPIRKAF